jgi:hypothetical protein
MSADQRLTKFIKEGKDWERKATSIPGIFLLRLPGLHYQLLYVSVESLDKRKYCLVNEQASLDNLHFQIQHEKHFLRLLPWKFLSNQYFP